MSTVRYKLILDRLFAVDMKDDRSGRLRLIFDGIKNGETRIGDARAHIKGGECTLELSRLDDGIHIPSIETDGRRIIADGLEKRGAIITVQPISDIEGRRLIGLVGTLGKRLGECEAEIKDLSNKLGSAKTF